MDRKRLLTLRYKENSAISKGALATFPDDNILVFEKSDKDAKILVIVNVRNEKMTLKVIPEGWQNQDVTDMVTTKDIKLEKTIELEPFQYLILKKK